MLRLRYGYEYKGIAIPFSVKDTCTPLSHNISLFIYHSLVILDHCTKNLQHRLDLSLKIEGTPMQAEHDVDGRSAVHAGLPNPFSSLPATALQMHNALAIIVISAMGQKFSI